jgi:hypothetical protein
MDVAVGCSLHTGWGVAVAVTGREQPEVVLRSRLALVDPALPAQAYHAAAGEPPAAATRLVRSVERSAREWASRAVAEVHDALTAGGHRLVAVAIAAEPREVPVEVATVVANHALIHAAEGELYRDAVETAIDWLAVPLLQVRAKGVAAEVQRVLGLGEVRQRQLAADLGAGLGPPWRADHKQAALLALVALADQVPGMLLGVAPGDHSLTETP